MPPTPNESKPSTTPIMCLRLPFRHHWHTMGSCGLRFSVRRTMADVRAAPRQAPRYVDSNVELLQAQEAGITADLYSSCRASGARHDEILELSANGYDLSSYLYCRTSGFGHDNLIEACSARVDLFTYSFARSCGSKHKHILAAARSGNDPGWYSLCRLAGANHAEAMALVRHSSTYTGKEAAVAAAAIRIARRRRRPRAELGALIAGLSEDWCGTADELAAVAVALLA